MSSKALPFGLKSSKSRLFSKLGLTREVTPVDLFAFGARGGYKGARAFQDFKIEPIPGVRVPLNGQVGLELPLGASTFADPLAAPLQGHYHRLPAGTKLPRGFGLKADGVDVIPISEQPATHYTIFPTRGMWLDEFNDGLLELPWEYAGKKVK